MNKLVSKNPVLRFKLGKLIIKADGGYKLVGKRNLRNLYTDGKRFYTLNMIGDGYTPIDETSYNGKSADYYYNLQSNTPISFWMGRDGWYSGLKTDHSNGNTTYANPTKITPEKIVPLKDGRVLAKINGKWYDGNGKEIITWVNSNPQPENDPKVLAYLQRQQEYARKNVDSRIGGGKNISQSANRGNSGTESNIRTLIYYSKGYQSGANAAGMNNVNDVRGILEMLFNEGLLSKDGNMRNGQWDGIWGKNTQKAYDDYMLRNQTLKDEGEIYNPQLSVEKEGESYISPIVPNILSPTTTTPKTVYNRTLTRDLMRKAGYNPYMYSGALRAALRHYLNGENYNSALLQGIDLNKFKFKSGGRLISKNPVSRFKLSFSKEAQFPR